MTPVLLAVHGSRDPRAARATRALVRAVAAARPGVDVRASYLDHTLPRPAQALSALEAAGHERVTLVPLLLTAAYHGRVDVPDAVRAARAAGLCLPVAVAGVLGPPAGGPVDDLLLAGLRRRLAEAGSGFDAVVLAAAGTRDAAARQTVVRAADALGASLGVPARVAYASAAAPTGSEAVARLLAAGAERVGVASYFLAPGLLYDTVVRSALDAGAVAAAQPLEGAAELAQLVLARADAADLPVLAAAAA
ncbi:sirohydrochlorin chelatase [Phytohabitans suffuscus]|uniref:Sirohydrochlorin chelatase n=1 Tax=Phytohabitans suffuscus TaxID=624315 RepID=A0A6F8YLN3_9ACTN|nr:sirohydrochlorin chelatase [Phytohabitans suffuscus]